MTVEELFHHQDRFIGCLTVRIVERPTAATRIPGTGEPLHPDDLAEWQDFVDATSFALPGALPPHLRIQLGTQGYEHPIFNNRCPALAPDGRCEIHDDRKPAMCSAVPLEPALPDGLQRVVLKRRMEEAGWMGAACIAEGEAAAGFVPMVEGRRVVQDGDRGALTVLRRQMRAETQRWGRMTFALLSETLTEKVRQGRGLHPHSYVVLPMTAVLEALARCSTADRRRCEHYAERQVELIAQTIRQTITGGIKSHRTATGVMRLFHDHYASHLSIVAAAA